MSNWPTTCAGAVSRPACPSRLRPTRSSPPFTTWLQATPEPGGETIMTAKVQSRQIATMLEKLRQLFPRHMQALREAKAHFETTYAAYEDAVQAGDGRKAKILVSGFQQSQAPRGKPPRRLGQAITCLLTVEKEGDLTLLNT